jgi:hypothetical protein
VTIRDSGGKIVVMNPRPLVLLSPFRPPTSYPVSLSDGEAAAWLNGYFALWHPAVVRGSLRPPDVASSYDHDQPLPGAVYCIPEGPSLFQPDDWLERLRAANAISFSSTSNREETVANAVEAMRIAGHHGTDDPAEIAGLFAAIGFGYLIVETWFDAAEHEHLLDQELFWSSVIAATGTDDRRIIREHLKQAAHTLQAAREVLHSGTVRLLDFVSLDPERLDAPWPASLAAGMPLNVVTSASILERLRDEQPIRFAELMAKCPPDLPAAVEFCIGSAIERDDTIMPATSQIWNLLRGREVGKSLTGRDITVYARQTSATHLHLPGWLLHAGYLHAVATPLDGAVAPHQSSPAIHWPGADGRALDAFAKEPLSASDAQTFFNLAYYLHQATGQESQPALAFRHTAQAGTGYLELLTLSDLGHVLGEWSGVGRYLTDVGPGDYSGTAGPDDYPIDTLDDRVTRRKQPDPVSTIARHLRLRRRLDSSMALAALHRMLTGPTEEEQAELTRLNQLETDVEYAGDTISRNHGFSERLEPLEQSIAQRLALRIQSRSEPDRPGYLVLNPCAFTRRVALELDPFPGAIPVDGPVKAAQFDADKTRLVVEVPSLGFAWIPRTSPGASHPKSKIKLAEGTIVRNDFFEAEFDPATGGIKAFRDLRTRSNRMAVVPVFNPGCKTRGTSLTVTQSGTALGELISEGQLVSELDEPLAEFRLRARAWAGRPVLELRCEFTRLHEPVGYPWHAYFGLRFGTRDDRVALFRGINGTSHRAGTGRVISPDFFEFRMGRERSFIFSGGLPFATKHGSRTVDLVLIPPGETESKFDLLLALDRDHPSQTAAGWVAPSPVVVTDRGPPPVGASGWLAHLDLPSLWMIDFRPSNPTGEGMTRGVAASFLETAGYAGSAELKFARDASRAFHITGTGEWNHEIVPVADAIPIEFSGGELFRIRAEW